MNQEFWVKRIESLLQTINYRELYFLSQKGFENLTENEIQIMFGSDGHHEIKEKFKELNTPR